MSTTLTYLVFAFALSALALCVHAHDRPELVDQIAEVKPSVLGIALFTPLDAAAPSLLGTGFVVGDGSYVVTNYHVVSKKLNPQIVQYYVALSGEGQIPEMIRMETVGIDPAHDLAILKLSKKLTPVALANNTLLPGGTDVFMTGFPIGAVLGLYPASHTGIIAAITPDVNPAQNVDDLTLKMLTRLDGPIMIYQLDITAFPGNSGSPVLSRKTGEVFGVLNKVLVSGGKEAALENPSGISYAIPVRYIRNLAQRNNVSLD
jgi:S1-C subfamily serine protease